MKQLNLSLEIMHSSPENAPMMATVGEMHADTQVKTEYPHFHYEGPEELPIPDSGKMTVEYEIVFKEETEKKVGDRTVHHYVCKVDLKKILSAEKEADMSPTRRDTSTEDALDQLMAQREADEDEDDEED